MPRAPDHSAGILGAPEADGSGPEVHGRALEGRGGAYGLRICGVRTDPSQLVEAPAHWPAFELRARMSTGPQPAADYVGDRIAVLRLRSGGSVAVDRHAARATFSLRSAPRTDALLHPHLAAPAVVAACWRGSESFHAGAFVAGDGVWAVLGEKGSGKSSALALLAQMGVPVLCDDVLVLDGTTALAGPRSIDLRGDAARELGVGEYLGSLGNRERWRLAVASIEPELPLRGWVLLRWGLDAQVRQIRGGDRLRAVLDHRALTLPPPDPTALLALSSLPVLELRRRRAWGSAQDSLQCLLDAIEQLTQAKPLVAA